MKYLLVSFIVIFCLFTACQKKGSPFSIIPFITYEGMRSDSVKAGSSKDSVTITFHFTDGDADLGHSINDTSKDIYVTDSRDTTQVLSFNFPSIDPSLENPDKGIEGDCTFSIPAAFMQARDSVHQVTGDTLHYSIYIKDIAGHNSNRINTPDIYLRP
ncbi:hypothetical protein ACTHGU_13950 [Chitinophagaceae bacterium MMS25-I14]